MVNLFSPSLWISPPYKERECTITSLPIGYPLYAPFYSQVGLSSAQVSGVLSYASFLGSRGTEGNVSADYQGKGLEDKSSSDFAQSRVFSSGWQDTESFQFCSIPWIFTWVKIPFNTVNLLKTPITGKIKRQRTGKGSIAQGLEHWSCKPGVASSNLAGAYQSLFFRLLRIKAVATRQGYQCSCSGRSPLSSAARDKTFRPSGRSSPAAVLVWIHDHSW